MSIRRIVIALFLALVAQGLVAPLATADHGWHQWKEYKCKIKDKRHCHGKGKCRTDAPTPSVEKRLESLEHVVTSLALDV